MLACGVARLTYAERLPLRVLTVADGLAGDSVTSILPDSRGFLWVGTTTGLSRFDGVAFRNFGVESGLRDAQVLEVGETPDGEIWALARHGLDRLETIRSRGGPDFHSVEVEGNVDPGLMLDLHVDGSGVLWVGSSRGLFRLERDVEPPVLRAIDLPLDDDARSVTAIGDDGRGGLWIGTYQGLIHREEQGSSRRLKVAPAGGTDRIHELVRDDAGRLWMATGYGAVVVADPLSLLAREEPVPALVEPTSRPAVDAPAPFFEAAEAERIPVSALPESPGAAVLLRHLSGATPPKFWVTGVIRGRDGAIWMRSSSSAFRVGEDGLRRLGPREGMVDATISALVEDRGGGLWIGTAGGGLVGWSRGGLTTVDGLGDDPSVAIGALFDATDREDLIVGGRSDRGNFLAVIRGNELREITPRAFREMAHQGWGWGQAFLHDRKGEWWIPTGEGLLRYAATSSSESLQGAEPAAFYSTSDGLGGNEIFRLFEDSKQDIWVSTLSKVALSRWRRASGTFETFPAFDGQLHGAPTYFLEGEDGTLWIGLYRGGMARWKEGSALRFFGRAHGLLDGLVTALHMDRRGRLWVGGFSGLVRSDDPAAEEPAFAPVSIPESRWAAGVRCVVEDDAGRIYVGGDQGVDRLEPESGLVTRFTTADGLGSNLTTVAHRDPEGNIWIGTRRGMSRFEEASGEATAAPPATRIVEIAIGGETVPLSALGEVEIRGLRLPPNTRRLDVGFVGLGVSPVTNMRYQALLSGVDDGWSAASAVRSLSFAGLAPGAYELLIRSLDSAGQPSARPALLTFRVQAAVWRRGWFLALAATLLILSAWVAHRRRVARLLALERVRSGIAADLHDDLGSSLARISLLAGVGTMRAERGEAGAAETLTEVGDIARELSEATSDIVWSIDPRRDDLASLVTRLKRFALDLLEGQGIAVTFDTTALPERLELTPQRRRDLFLLLKEAIHNVAKHAQAKRVEIRFGVGAGGLEVEIADDGVGFSPEAATREGSGNGLLSMRRRAEAQRGSLDVESAPGAGTRLRIRLPL